MPTGTGKTQVMVAGMTALLAKLVERFNLCVSLKKEILKLSACTSQEERIDKISAEITPLRQKLEELWISTGGEFGIESESQFGDSNTRSQELIRPNQFVYYVGNHTQVLFQVSKKLIVLVGQYHEVHLLL